MSRTDPSFERIDKKKKARLKEIVAYNKKILDNLSLEYGNTRHYLRGVLLRTLFEIYDYLKNREIEIHYNTCYFFLDETSLARKVRGTMYKRSSVQYMNMLCCLGIITKTDPRKAFQQTYNNFRASNPSKRRQINTFCFKKLTEKELKKIERRAKKLRSAGITTSNVSKDKLLNEGLTKIAEEVYPKNSKTSLDKKKSQYVDMVNVIDSMIETKGYAKRTEIFDLLNVSKTKFQRLLWVFSANIEERYNYKKPTKSQKEKYQLTTGEFIYTAKTQ